MNSTFTQQNSTKHYIIIRRTIILLLVCIFIPGCINKADNSANGAWMATGSINVAFSYAGHYQHILQVSDSTLNDAEISVPVNEVGKANDNAGDRSLPVNLLAPVQLLDIEHHIDPHHTGDEETVMAISLPRLLRLAIMLFTIIIII